MTSGYVQKSVSIVLSGEISFRNNLRHQTAYTRIKNNSVAIIKMEFATTLEKKIDTDGQFCEGVDRASVRGSICDAMRFVLVARFRLLREKVGQEKSDLLRGGLGEKGGEDSPPSERIRLGRIRSVCRAQISQRAQLANVRHNLGNLR